MTVARRARVTSDTHFPTTSTAGSKRSERHGVDFPRKGKALPAQADNQSLASPSAEQALELCNGSCIASGWIRCQFCLDRDQMRAVFEHEVHFVTGGGAPEVQSGGFTAVQEQSVELAEPAASKTGPAAIPESN